MSMDENTEKNCVLRNQSSKIQINNCTKVKHI